MRLLNRITKVLFLPIKLTIRLLSGGRVFPSKAQRARIKVEKYYARKRWETAMNPNLNSGRRKENSTTPYLSIHSLKEDVQSLHNQINDPLGGIKNIQDEHSRFIQKNAKNRLQCLEDNVDMLLKKYIPKRYSYIKAVENKVKALEEENKELKHNIELIQNNLKYNKKDACFNQLFATYDEMKVLEDKLTQLIQKDSNLTFFLPDEQSEAEDFWDKESREAYDEYMQSL